MMIGIIYLDSSKMSRYIEKETKKNNTFASIELNKR